MRRKSKLKDLARWDEDYLTNLPSGEFDWIEYKASAKFTAADWTYDMSKYVSAWANYGGGYIIYGIEDPKDGSRITIDGGIPATIKKKLADWLDDVVPRLVEPPIQKLSTLLIHPKSRGSKIKAGHVVLVIHIPQSEAAPHQALDHKYYQRLGRRLDPLKHRLIFDIAGRRRYPSLQTTVLIHTGGGEASKIFWKLENVGAVLALHWKVVIHFPTAINGKPVFIPDEKVLHGETEDGKSFLKLTIPQMLGSPLFPGSEVSRSFALAGGVSYTYPLKPSIEEIRIRTFADEMPPFEEIIRLSDALRQRKGGLQLASK